MEKIYKFENAKATVDENGVVTVVVNEIYQPKDGEIVMFQDRPDSVFIYRKVDILRTSVTTYYVALCAGVHLLYNDPYHMLRGCDFSNVAPATEEAKQLLFDALKSRNLAWDPETKQVIKWRAKHGGGYFYISDCGTVKIDLDTRRFIDNKHFDFGNYFATKAFAIKALENIKENLHNI